MTDTNTLPSYTDIAEALSHGESTFLPSEAHGYLCALLCTSPAEDYSWQEIVFPASDDPSAHTALADLYESSMKQMSAFAFEFHLLLPDDDEDINSRAESLGVWCQGFLTGLNGAEKKLELSDENEVKDALNDIIDISQVTYGELTSTDEDETAYYELVEYIRLVVLMIYQEFKKLTPNSDSNQTTVLH
jgi:yecA family protein